MNILIAYDGSDASEEALEDLLLAGLPVDCHATIMTVVEYWSSVPQSYMAGVDLTFEETALACNRLGEDRLHEFFPAWTIGSDVMRGFPASTILEHIEKNPFDLVVVGQRPQSRIERVMFGSVSHSLLVHAPCSVRIARGHDERGIEAPRLLLAYDGSLDSDRAVDQLLKRKWEQGTELTIVTAINEYANEDLSENEQNRFRAEHQKIIKRCSEAGLHARSICTIAEPKELILDEAATRHVDTIFLGATGHSMIARLLLGSTSAAVAMRADCSVEIVRIRESTQVGEE